MLKLQFVGRGMHLEFHHPEYSTPIVTSPIQQIRDFPATGRAVANDSPAKSRSDDRTFTHYF